MRKRCFGILLIGLLVAACSFQDRGGAVVEYLDEATGYTVRHLNKSLVFYRDQPGLAAHARDYLSLGPVVLSRGGRTEYLLWVCDWSTIDRVSWLRSTRPGLVLELEGEVIELAPAPLPRLGRFPYRRPVNGGSVYYYQLTRSQMSRVFRSNELRALVGGAQGREEFLVWRGQQKPVSLLEGNAASSDPALAR